MFHGSTLQEHHTRQAKWSTYRQIHGPIRSIVLAQRWAEEMEALILERDTHVAAIAGLALIRAGGENALTATVCQAVTVLRDCWEFGGPLLDWAQGMGIVNG